MSPIKPRTLVENQRDDSQIQWNKEYLMIVFKPWAQASKKGKLHAYIRTIEVSIQQNSNKTNLDMKLNKIKQK